MLVWGPFVLRSAAGAVFVAHGLQRLLVLWTESAELAISTGLVVGVLEVLGGLLLIVGALTFCTAIVLLGQTGLLLWRSDLAGGAGAFAAERAYVLEFHFLLMAVLLALLLSGPGALSLDGYRTRSLETWAAARARLRAAGH
jgi:putative oxidoreductase